MDRPTKIIIAGISTGILLFVVFTLLTVINYPVYSIAFNNFMSMIGVILSFISGFFFISMRTLNK